MRSGATVCVSCDSPQRSHSWMRSGATNSGSSTSSRCRKAFASGCIPKSRYSKSVGLSQTRQLVRWVRSLPKEDAGAVTVQAYVLGEFIGQSQVASGAGGDARAEFGAGRLQEAPPRAPNTHDARGQ